MMISSSKRSRQTPVDRNQCALDAGGRQRARLWEHARAHGIVIVSNGNPEASASRTARDGHAAGLKDFADGSFGFAAHDVRVAIDRDPRFVQRVEVAHQVGPLERPALRGQSPLELLPKDERQERTEDVATNGLVALVVDRAAAGPPSAPPGAGAPPGPHRRRAVRGRGRERTGRGRRGERQWTPPHGLGSGTRRDAEQWSAGW